MKNNVSELAVSGDLGSSTTTYSVASKKLAVLSIYELNTGKPIHFVDDGVTLLNNKNILVIANRASGVNNDKAIVVKSNDGWKTARIIDEYKFANVYPTTGVVKNGKIYVLHSSLNLLVNATPAEKNKMHKRAVIQQIGSIRP